MKQFLLLFLTVITCSQAFAQSELVERVPESVQDVNTNRAPNGTTSHQAIRGIMLLKASELTNIPTTKQISQLSFVYQSGTNTPTDGTLRFYIQNSTDAVMTKTGTWSTDVAGMTLVYDGAYSIPEGAAAAEAPFLLSNAFFYNGGSVYVAYEYIGNTFSTVAASYKVNTTFASSIRTGTNASNATPPASLSGTASARPQLLFGFENPYTNEVKMNSMLLGRSIENKFFFPGNTVRVEVENRGTQDRTNLPVTVTVSGANPFSTTQTITSLPAGETAVVTFSNLPTNVSGTQTVTATIPSDDNPANNSKSATQTVDCSSMQYYEPISSPDAVGYGAGPGIVAARFGAPATTPVLVKGVNIRLSADVSAPGKEIYGVLMDKDGIVLDRTDDYTIATADVGTNKHFEFLSPTQVPAGEVFYLGIGQKTSGPAYTPFYTYNAVNVDFQPIYLIMENGSLITPISNKGVVGIEALVDGLPVTLTTSATEICSGLPVTLTAASGFAYPAFEFKSGTTVLQSTAATTYNYSPSAYAQVVVSGIYNGCPVVSAPVSITVKPSPTVAAITGAATVCGNASTQLATTTTGGVWSSSDEAIATVDQSGLVTGVAGGPGGPVVISYSVTANGCTGAATHNLNVNTPGAISPVTGVTDVCIGSTITLANATPAGVWSSSDGNVATVNNGVITTVAVGTTTISYTVTDVNGCSGAADAVVTVRALPAVPVITGSTAVCEDEQITLSSVTTGGVWSVNDATIATVGAANGAVTGVMAGSAVITYTITDQYSCSNAGTYNVTVNPAATVAAITGANSVCVNSSIVLANATGGGTWSSGDETIALVNATTGEVTGVAEGAATISYTVTNGSGCAATATVVLNVHALPVVPAITGTNSICIGTTTTLANTVSGGVWSSDDAPVATVDATTGEVTGIGAGTATINYTYTNANGCATTRTFDVVVNTAVTVPAFTGGSSVCVGSVLDLDNTVTGGVWTSDNTAAATVNAATGQVTGIGSGTTNITYTLTVATGCSGSYTGPITVNALPAAPVITGANEVCAGSTITLNGDASGTWSSSSNAIATVSAAGVVTGVSAGTTSITLTVTNGNGCTSSTNYSITVKAKPGIGAITGGSEVCEGETLFLGNAASGGVWASDNNSVATVSTAGVVSGVANGTVNITYTVTGGGCSNTATNPVTVNPTPVVPAIGGTTAVCEGSTINLTNTFAGGVWSSSNTAVATVSGTGVVTGIAGGTATISYTVTNGSGCSTAQQVTITVNPLPVVAITSSVSAVCVGANVTLTATPAGGTWSSDNASVATINAAGQVTGITAGSANITYTYTNGNGCTAAAQVAFTVNALPAQPVVSGTAVVCASATTSLSATVAGGTWSSSNTSVATVSNTGVVTGVAAGSATITYTVTSGSCTSSQQVTVTVNAQPSAGTISGGNSVCQNGTLSLSSSVAGGTWSTDNSTVASVSNGLVTGLSAGTAKITYTLNSNGCSGISEVTVTVRAIPVPGTISGASTICAGGSATLTNSVAGGTWSSDQPAVAAVNNAGLITGVAAGNATITYTVTNADNCSASTTHPVTVSAAPAAVTFTGGDKVCIGASITLVPSVAGGTWTTSNTAIASVANGTVTGVTAGTVTISYTATTSGGCVTSGTQTVTVSALPSAGNITGTSNVCVGGETQLNASVAGGAWSSNNINVAYVNTSGMVSGVAAGNATIRYTVSSNGCSNTAEFAVVVNTNVAAGAITGPDNVCTGSNIQLAHATAGGTWSSSNNALATVSAGGLVTGVSAGAVQVMYTMTGGGGCATTTSHNVTVNALPSVAITNIDSVCLADGKVTLTANLSGGAWSGEGVSGNEWNFGSLGAGSTLITYTYTNSNGCTATATKTIRRVDCRGIDTRPGVLASLDLMPNPATNFIKLKINVQTGAGLWTVQITNVSGIKRLTYRTDLVIGANEKVIDISNLPQGIYFLTVQHGDKFETRTFIKAR